MGCGCNKNKGNNKRASENLKKAYTKNMTTNMPAKQNDPSFPLIPQLSESNSRKITVTPPSDDDKEESIEQPSLKEKIKNFGKSVASRVTQGKADEKLVKLRVLSCHGDDEVVSCPYRNPSNVKEGFFYCNACGCGDKPRAFLNNPNDADAYTKLHYPWVSCPVHMPGFGDYKPYAEETEEDIQKYKEGMERKKLVEIILRERGEDIPPAYSPTKNGDSE